MKPFHPSPVGNFATLALGAVFAVGLACDTAQAFLVPLDDYSVEGTVYLNPGVSVDPTAMYFAAYYYDNLVGEPGVTVAQASLPTDTTYNATVSIPLDANITGFGLLGVYFDGGNVSVSFPGTDGIIGSDWSTVFPSHAEPDIYTAMVNNDFATLEAFAWDARESITTALDVDSYLVGFSAGQEIGNAVVDSITPVPEPGSVSLLMTLGLLPTLLRRRRHA
jgi:hypothetical protein